MGLKNPLFGGTKRGFLGGRKPPFLGVEKGVFCLGVFLKECRGGGWKGSKAGEVPRRVKFFRNE